MQAVEPLAPNLLSIFTIPHVHFLASLPVDIFCLLIENGFAYASFSFELGTSLQIVNYKITSYSSLSGLNPTICAGWSFRRLGVADELAVLYNLRRRYWTEHYVTTFLDKKN